MPMKKLLNNATYYCVSILSIWVWYFGITTPTTTHDKRVGPFINEKDCNAVREDFIEKKYGVTRCWEYK